LVNDETSSLFKSKLLIFKGKITISLAKLSEFGDKFFGVGGGAWEL